MTTLTHAIAERRTTPRREDRLPAFVGHKGDANVRLNALHIAVVGVGSVGANVAEALARLMISLIVLIDPGRWKASSLLTSPISPANVGRWKVDTVGVVCARISPRTRISRYRSALREVPLTALDAADVVVLATDNIGAEIAAGELCLSLGKPLIVAGVYGPTLQAQVRFFPNRHAVDACPTCSLGPAEWQAVEREMRFTCSPDGVVEQRSAQPTRSVAPLCSAAADLALFVLLRWALGLRAPESATHFDYCGVTHESRESASVRSPRCRAPHMRYDRVSIAGSIGEMTPAQLVRTAAFGTDAPVTIEFDDMVWLSELHCGKCGKRHTKGGLVVREAPIRRRCKSCGWSLHPRPHFTYRRVRMNQLPMDRPIARLTGRRVRWAIVTGSGRSVLVWPHNDEQKKGNVS